MRLIDADRYAEVLERYINAPHVRLFGKYSNGMQIAISTCIELLNAQRTLGAVEVVRCKDCKHNVANKEHDPLDITDYTDIVCDYWMSDGNLPEDFCSRGEKKDDG